MPAVLPLVAGQPRTMAPASRSATSNDELSRAEKEAAPAEETRARVQSQPFQAVYSIASRVTVPATGEMKRVQMDYMALDPVLNVRTVPKREQKAYLYAKLTVARGTPVLPGAVALFRDTTFVGNGRLPLLVLCEEHELGFGVDDSIRVRHAVVEEKRGETGLITSSKTDVRNYRITVKNLARAGRSRSPCLTRSRCRRTQTSRSSCWARRRRPSATSTTSAACSPGR